MPQLGKLPISPGDVGDDVAVLQQALARAGFSPGAFDNVFGPATEAATLAFQKSEGLTADGVVGLVTAGALGIAPVVPPPPAGMPPITVAIASAMCPGALTANITSNLPLVMNALLAAKITPPLLVLASIATIRAETAGFAPLDEGISQFNTSPGGHPFDLYDNRSDLGNLGAPDGASFKGRGFVQLTGRANYTRIGGQIGVDLVGTPNLANDPATSAAILATFIANNRVVISNALAANNLGAARAAVNGGHNGLSNFVDAYNTGRAALGV